MFMIKSDDQRQKTVKTIEGFKAQARKIQKEHGDERATLFTKAYQHHVAELQEQVRLYDELKEKGLPPLVPRHLSEVGPYLVKARIASGLTQSELAKRLGVSQPMVFKYEHFQYQGISLETLGRVAKELGVSLYLETFQRPRKRAYHPKRQAEAMLFFAQQISNTYLGRTKLMKLLYYADYEWLEKTGITITGDAYFAMPYGPVPKHAEQTLRQLKKAGAIRVEKTKVGHYDQDRCAGLREPDMSLFSTEEVVHLNNIARRFAFWTATQMSDLSHEDWPWQSTPLGKEIVF